MNSPQHFGLAVHKFRLALGPLLFCLTTQPLLLSLQSELTLGYMDDLTLGGDENAVEDDIGRITDASDKLGLHLNRDKCEVIHQPGCAPGSPIFQPFIHVASDAACLLGASLLPGPGLDSILTKHWEILTTAVDRLKSIGRHDALILLRSCFGVNKLQYVLRTSPCHGHPALPTLDSLLRTGLSAITNCSLIDPQWIQARLPVRDGGLGVRDVTSLAIPAFLASAAGTLGLQDAILASASTPQDTFVREYSDRWSSLFSIAPPDNLIAGRQSSWLAPYITADKATVSDSAPDNYTRVCLLAVSAPHSSDWLHALPITACGLRLDDEAIRVAVGLRLGVTTCVPHQCPCGAFVDARGSHGLSCKQAAGRSTRHHQLNDLIWRALERAGTKKKHKIKQTN